MPTGTIPRHMKQMRFTSPLRLPLQTGGTALSTVLFTFVLIPFYWGLWPILVLYLMGRDASRRRASDIVLSSDGLEVRGGPHHGYAAKWSEIAPQSTYVKLTDEVFYKQGDDPTVFMQTFVVGDIELARGGDVEEVASFRALASLVEQAARGVAPGVSAPPNVGMCPSCGAALVPVDDDTTRCAYCAAVVAVPPHVREAVRATAVARREGARMTTQVRRTLTGGRASTVNRLVLACGLSGQAAVPLAIAAFVEHDAGLAFIPLVVPVILAAMARAVISKRIAVRSLAFGCAAIAPADPSHAPSCRRCRAPLAAVDELGALATCAYCGATNVLGIDVGNALAGAEGFAEVDDVIARHRRSVAKSWAIAIAGLAACTAGVLLSR